MHHIYTLSLVFSLLYYFYIMMCLLLIVVFVVPSEYRTTAVGKAALAAKYHFLMAWKDTVLATVCKY